MQFSIPPSFVAYATDREVRTAVDFLLGRRRPKIPAALGWNELPAFYEAVLSAHQVKFEFPMILFRLWEQIWRPAWERLELGVERGERTIVEAEEWHDQRLDPATVWEEGWFGGTLWFRAAGSLYEVGVGTNIDEKSRVQLGVAVYLSGSDTWVTENLQLDDELWPAEHFEDDYAWTSPELVTVTGPEIRICELQSAAINAFECVAAYAQE